MNFPDNNLIDLFVKGRIAEVDATRQMKTVKAILSRFNDQPGLILADEVGMGKTFVALAVAVSVYMKGKRPTVIMVPPNLVPKWKGDFNLFVNSCLPDPDIRNQLRCSIATRPEELLSLLEETGERKPAVIILKHGALSRKMGDGFFKLAIIQRALSRRRNVEEISALIEKYAGDLVEMKYLQGRNRDVDIWSTLLRSAPVKWKSILIKKLFIEADAAEPISMTFINELNKVGFRELDDLFNQLEMIPKRRSANITDRLIKVRKALNEEAILIWKRCLANIKLDLPLLIFDEAHHLKNSDTQLVTSLFHEPVADEEAGMLSGQFDRMLFLTATPFQLGHDELMNVLKRFSNINWHSDYKISMTANSYKEELYDLHKKLDISQAYARRLDAGWSKLIPIDLCIKEHIYTDTMAWWNAVVADDTNQTLHIQKVVSDFKAARDKLKSVEPILQKYVIRHLKPRIMTYKSQPVLRRVALSGDCILGHAHPDRTAGLEVTKDAMLPFLLAARLTTIQQDKRPVYAEGLASSFEAFRLTKEARMKNKQQILTDTDDEIIEVDQAKDPVAGWYLEQLDKSLEYTATSGSHHPKIKPTVDKAIDLWSKGEKVLIFCHYIATGKALRKYVSHEMRVQIIKLGAKRYRCNENSVFKILEETGSRITRSDSASHRRCDEILSEMIDDYPALLSLKSDIKAAVFRYMRTPSFLIRFAAKDEAQTEVEWIDKSFDSVDDSGVSLKETIRSFVEFLNNRNEDRETFITALRSIQPGGIRTKDVENAFNNDDLTDESENVIMANVRLCYGATDQETRQRLMKTFNTPFFPDILITSSVMSEGVDLHLNCRHIIHHDLSWNPSTLEQRTGRLDRIGAKSEKFGKSIHVYLPYLAETQDEKMYKVVMERERWFNVLMGEKYKFDAVSTDKYAERIPLPEELSKELSFSLEVM